MTFIKRFLGRKDKAVEPMHGAVPARNADIDHQADRATRSRMEAEVVGDRERRGAVDVRPTDSEQ